MKVVNKENMIEIYDMIKNRFQRKDEDIYIIERDLTGYCSEEDYLKLTNALTYKKRIYYDNNLLIGYSSNSNGYILYFLGDNQIISYSNVAGNSYSIRTVYDIGEKFTPGTGLELTEDKVLNCTLDTTVFKVVESLPTQPASGDENKIHLVKENSDEGNLFNEYLYVEDKWELIGQQKSNISDNGIVWRRLEEITINFVDKEDANVGDIVLVKGKTKLIVKKDSDLHMCKEKGLIPIGVIAIPTSHNVYGTEETSMISLNDMSVSTPDNGADATDYDSDNNLICFGQFEADLNLPALSQIPKMYRKNESEYQKEHCGMINGTSAMGYMANDMYTSFKVTGDTIYDTTRGYYEDNAEVLPSPFLNNGERNPLYYITNKYYTFDTESVDLTQNCLSDFDGRRNTTYLCLAATAQRDWRTDSTIENNPAEDYSPAACCCWRYHTEGTKQGDWYLPAMGELGYVAANYKLINEALTLIRDTWNIGVTIPGEKALWSSTNHSNEIVKDSGDYGRCSRFIDFYSCHSTYRFRKNNYAVRAFCRI